jgi:hypothetical protein
MAPDRKSVIPAKSWRRKNAIGNGHKHDRQPHFCPQPEYMRTEWTKTALQPYRRYPKLYAERKYAKPAVSLCNQPQPSVRHANSLQPEKPFPFLQLPSEQRNQIYSELLDFRYIELAAKRAGDLTDGLARAHRMLRYRRKIQPNLRLLRVNKQLDEECSSFFYGENEFRFTSVIGFDVLLFFCRTIRKANTERLRKITQHIPLYGEPKGDCGTERLHSGSNDAKESKNRWHNFQELMARMGLHAQGSGGRKFNVPRTSCRLGSALEYYRLVLPNTFCIWQAVTEDSLNATGRSPLGWMSAKKSKEVKIETLRLYDSLVPICSSLEASRSSDEHLGKRLEVVPCASQRGWRFGGGATFDKNGCWEVGEIFVKLSKFKW